MKVPTLSIFGILIISSIPLALASTVGNSSYCPTKFKGIEDHTACIPRSEESISGGLTEEEINNIVSLHNKIRTEVKPPACAMMKMYWDDELAFLAQKWADNCRYNHDKNLQRSIPGSYLVGQNLAIGEGNWSSFIIKWQEEKAAFTYNGTNSFSKVSHYTQMIWEASTLIGCGFGKCKKINLHVCNYGPGGNTFQNSIPYKKCDLPNPLKDCKGKVCKNGGEFKRDSCECTCKETPQISGPMCEINCTISDQEKCGSTFKPEQCKILNTQYECPWMCKLCPYVNGSGSFKYWATYFLSVLSVLFLIQMM